MAARYHARTGSDRPAVSSPAHSPRPRARGLAALAPSLPSMHKALLGLVIVGCGSFVGCGGERDEVADEIMRQQASAETASAAGRDGQALRAVFSELPALEARLEGFPPGTEVHQSTFDDGSPRAEGFLNDRKPIGRWRYWHETGALAAQGDYKYGARKHGKWTTWNEHGIRLSTGTWDAGERVGSWSFWYPNGRPSLKGPYRLGQRHGFWHHWHPTGAKAAEGNYIRDQRSGMWKQWDIAGEPLSDIQYRAGDIAER